MRYLVVDNTTMIPTTTAGSFAFLSLLRLRVYRVRLRLAVSVIYCMGAPRE